MNNVLDLLKEELKKHKVLVKLSGEKKAKSYFLIAFQAEIDFIEDMKATYGKKVESIHIKLAKKLHGSKKKFFEYGVLVDKDLNFIFAFNRLFADYDKKNKEIKYKDIDDVLVEGTKVQLEDLLPIKPKPPAKPSFPGGNLVMRYSLAEKEEK